MKKPTLLITLIGYDDSNDWDNQELQRKYGYGNYALMQGKEGINTQISLIKLLRAVTGSQLKPAKEACDAIFGAVNALGNVEVVRQNLVNKISSMNGNQLRSLLGIIDRDSQYHKDPFKEEQ